MLDRIDDPQRVGGFCLCQGQTLLQPDEPKLPLGIACDSSGQISVATTLSTTRTPLVFLLRHRGCKLLSLFWDLSTTLHRLLSLNFAYRGNVWLPNLHVLPRGQVS